MNEEAKSLERKQNVEETEMLKKKYEELCTECDEKTKLMQKEIESKSNRIRAQTEEMVLTIEKNCAEV